MYEKHKRLSGLWNLRAFNQLRQICDLTSCIKTLNLCQNANLAQCKLTGKSFEITYASYTKRCNAYTQNTMRIRIVESIILVLIFTLLGCKSESNDKHMETIKKNHKSVENLWDDFLKDNPNNRIKKTPLSFYFCDNEKDADECAELVVKGIKQATATSLWWYEKNNETLPKVGDQYVVTNWNGYAKAVIETIKIEQIPYNQMTAEFAEIEGEGDKSLEYWKRVHEAYYKREMEPHGDKFDENMIIVCEYFKTIYKVEK